jgi:hypothetical protein
VCGFRPQPCILIVTRPAASRADATKTASPFFRRNGRRKHLEPVIPSAARRSRAAGPLGFAPPGYPGFTLSRIAASPHTSDRCGRHFRFSEKIAGGRRAGAQEHLNREGRKGQQHEPGFNNNDRKKKETGTADQRRGRRGTKDLYRRRRPASLTRRQTQGIFKGGERVILWRRSSERDLNNPIRRMKSSIKANPG